MGSVGVVWKDDGDGERLHKTQPSMTLGMVHVHDSVCVCVCACAHVLSTNLGVCLCVFVREDPARAPKKRVRSKRDTGTHWDRLNNGQTLVAGAEAVRPTSSTGHGVLPADDASANGHAVAVLHVVDVHSDNEGVADPV